MNRAKSVILTCSFFFFMLCLRAQTTFPENGVADVRHGYYAFTNATIVKDGTTTLQNATLVIKDGRIVSVGTAVKAPQGVVVIDCSGKWLYPSFIDINADYGTTVPPKPQSEGGFFARGQLESATKGAYGW